MCNDNVIRRFAGVFILLSVLLGFTVSANFFYVTGFVGLNLLQSSFTNFCPLEKILAYFGLFGCRMPTQNSR